MRLASPALPAGVGRELAFGPLARGSLGPSESTAWPGAIRDGYGRERGGKPETAESEEAGIEEAA